MDWAALTARKAGARGRTRTCAAHLSSATPPWTRCSWSATCRPPASRCLGGRPCRSGWKGRKPGDRPCAHGCANNFCRGGWQGLARRRHPGGDLREPLERLLIERPDISSDRSIVFAQEDGENVIVTTNKMRRKPQYNRLPPFTWAGPIRGHGASARKPEDGRDRCVGRTNARASVFRSS